MLIHSDLLENLKNFSSKILKFKIEIRLKLHTNLCKISFIDHLAHLEVGLLPNQKTCKIISVITLVMLHSILVAMVGPADAAPAGVADGARVAGAAPDPAAVFADAAEEGVPGVRDLLGAGDAAGLDGLPHGASPAAGRGDYAVGEGELERPQHVQLGHGRRARLALLRRRLLVGHRAPRRHAQHRRRQAPLLAGLERHLLQVLVTAACSCSLLPADADADADERC